MDTKKLRQKILDLAIHGKLVPQDPNDEPASVLLERIRAEKEQLIKEGKIKRQKKSTSSDTSHYGNDVPFEVPEGWVWCNITEITYKITDGTHHSPISYPRGDYMYVTAKNIKESGVSLDNMTFVTSEVFRDVFSRCNPELGDILYIKDGATTGVVTINDIKDPFCLLSSVALIKPSKSIDRKYLLYYLRSSTCYSSVRESMKGVGITRVTLKQIENWVVPIPPLPEQKRIVDEVEKWFVQIDAIEQDSSDLKDAVQKAKSKILDLALSGRLTSDTSHYPKLPEGWGNKDFSQLFEVLTSKSYQIQQKEIHQSGKYPVISQSALYIEGYSDIEEKLYNAETPVIIFGDHTRNVKYVNFDFIVGADGVKILKPTINSKFAYYLTLYNSKQIENRGYSRHFQYLKQQSWSIPSEKEQQKIVEIIEHYFRVFDIIITELGDLRYCQ